jgi:tetratricopeptide (TPR) repeat protein
MSARFTEKTILLRALAILFSLFFLGTEMACRKQESTESTGLGQTSQGKLSVKDQEKLAERLYSQMSKTDKWEIDTFLKLHTQVIEQCPDTESAQESLWRLSNLYMTGTSSEPDYPKIAELMEKLISRYPNSQLRPLAWNRLRVAYEGTKNYAKVLPLYEDKISATPGFLDDPQNAADLLAYGKALAQTEHAEKAKEIYRKIIGWKDKIDSWMIDNAVEEMEYLSGGRKNVISPEDVVRVVMDLPEMKNLNEEYQKKGWKLIHEINKSPKLEDGRWVPPYYIIGFGRDEGGSFKQEISFQVDCFKKAIQWINTGWEDMSLEEWRGKKKK